MNQNNTSNVDDEPTGGDNNERNNNRDSLDGSTNVGSSYRVSFGAGDQDENITNTNSHDDESTNTPNNTVNQQQQDKIAALTEALMAVLNHNNDGSTSTQTSTGGSGRNFTTSTGLTLRRDPRTSQEQQTVRTLSKHDRGKTAAERLKTKKLACTALPNKLCVSTIMDLTSATEIDEHSIAADCKRWQESLRGLKERFRTFDMVSIFMIPVHFDPYEGTVQSPYHNLLEEYGQIPFEACQLWQTFLRRVASDEDMESDVWAQTIMTKSMDKDLLSTVMDDFERLKEDEQGSVTMFKIMIDIMVIQNQEALDAMHNFIRNFDIREYDGQNVVRGASHLKAVIRALGPTQMPANATRSIVNGFAQADNDEFKQLCQSSGAMFSSTILSASLPSHIRDDPAQSCLALLRDFVQRYQQLVTAKKWNGATQQASTFKATSDEAMIEQDHTAFAARLPFEEWVKNIRCNGCGETGHIKPDCPKNPYRRTEQERATALARHARNGGYGGGRVLGRGGRQDAGRGRSFGRGPFSRGVGRGYGRSGGTQRGQRDRMQRAFEASMEVYNAIMGEEDNEEVPDADVGDDQDTQDVEDETTGHDDEEELDAYAAAMWQSIGSSSLKE